MSKTIWYILAVLIVIGLGFLYWNTSGDEAAIETSVSVAEAMAQGGDQEGYQRVSGPRDFTFPDDHGPHPGYKTEWWYYTGNLFTEDGRQFGYQFTIFRNQLNPPENAAEDQNSTSLQSDSRREPLLPADDQDSTSLRSDSLSGPPSEPQLPDKDSTTFQSDWETNQLYLGHFAISDVENENHVFEERFSRGAAGLAGAEAEPYRIWLEDWEVKNTGTKNVDEQYFPVQIKAGMADAESAGGAAIDLTVSASKPLTLQGDKGYDRKGAKKGNASYYHSFTRMDTKGSLKINGQKFEVSGSSWMDHEWSTSALDEGQDGWDWFSIQLSNGYDLMYYQLRNADGSVSKFTTGALVGPDGEKTTIEPSDVEIEVLDDWESPHSKSVYPSEWEMRIPKVDLSLDLQTLFDDQEMDVSVRYYEGTVSVSGNMDGDAIGGNGFIEMTGYERDE
jgi:predicted secreted hydrolase